MIGLTLTEEQQAIQQAAREFAEREVKPVRREREAIPDPTERFPWDLVERGSRLGFRTLLAPAAYGGAGADILTQCIMNEELGAADLGVATVFDQTSRLARMLFRFCNDDQRERFLLPFMRDDRALLAVGMTEHSAGSDAILPYDVPGAGPQTYAEQRGDRYVINGEKGFISIGSDASLYAIVARTNRSSTFSEAMTGFLVKRGTPGLEIGAIWDKVGQRLINNADLVFENLEVPVADRIGEEGTYGSMIRAFMRGGPTTAAALILGVGREAYELAAAYAKQRVQGGQPIIDHQAIGMILADMATRIECARLLVWKAAWATDYQEPFDSRLPGMSKVFASEAAFDCARYCLEIHGGSGIMKNLPVEKLLRDASTMFHSDGTNQIHRLRVLAGIKRGL
ncbi:MAG: acyl-CoA dehydrogenase family protein [Chloroflexi bacterium]|nr:acyl-CoA dehydrogenase family protein [Chloroflexota bacterium]